MAFGILDQIILGWLVIHIVIGLDLLMIEKELQIMSSALDQVQYYGVHEATNYFIVFYRDRLYFSSNGNMSSQSNLAEVVLLDLKQEQKHAIAIYCDNLTTIAITKNPIFHNCTKCNQLFHCHLQR